MKMSVGHWWNDTDRRKPKYSEETLVPVLLYPPQSISPGSNAGPRPYRPATNCLSLARPKKAEIHVSCIKINFLPHRKKNPSIIKTNPLMLFRGGVDVLKSI